MKRTFAASIVILAACMNQARAQETEISAKAVAKIANLTCDQVKMAGQRGAYRLPVGLRRFDPDHLPAPFGISIMSWDKAVFDSLRDRARACVQSYPGYASFLDDYERNVAEYQQGFRDSKSGARLSTPERPSWATKGSSAGAGGIVKSELPPAVTPPLPSPPPTVAEVELPKPAPVVVDVAPPLTALPPSPSPPPAPPSKELAAAEAQAAEAKRAEEAQRAELIKEKEQIVLMTGLMAYYVIAEKCAANGISFDKHQVEAMSAYIKKVFSSAKQNQRDTAWKFAQGAGENLRTKDCHETLQTMQFYFPPDVVDARPAPKNPF